MFESLGLILGTTLMYSTPLIFAAMGGLVSEKSGVVNIALEGLMTFGAFVSAAVSVLTGNPWLGLLIAAFAGACLASFHAVASIFFQANQIISGIAINFLGTGLSIFLCKMIFDGTTMTPPIELEKKIPRPVDGIFPPNSFFDHVFNQYATVYLAFFVVFVLFIFLYYTPSGLRLRAVGEHPKAASTLGVSVVKIRLTSVLASGFLAALGGASLSTAIVANFRPTLISGQGFIALSALIFGNWKPMQTLFACLFFGLAQALVIFLGGIEGIKIPSQILSIFPYLLTLIILVGLVGKSRPPKANGEAYEA